VRTYTIGEVLNQLKDEFEDITISKIRFLESEGLISPDRTDSGYRKFTDPDVDRLRYVLRAQRDRYLPLKVIKDELERLDAGLPVEDRSAAPPETDVALLGAEPRSGTHAAGRPAPAAAVGTDPPQTPSISVLDAGPTDVRLELRELCEATGLEMRDIQELRDHGLVKGEASFDGDDLRVAKAAAALMELGLEARHLRMYRQFADRELSLCEQLVAPLLRQRNPDSRRVATEQLDDLTREGARLHAAVLARELRGLLRS